MMTTSDSTPIASMVIRGVVHTDDLIEVGGRGGDLTFRTPDAHRHSDELALRDPGHLADLYRLSFDDIVDYLDQLGRHLDIATNERLQRACELSYQTAPTTRSIVDQSYAGLGQMFCADLVREIAETQVGIPYLEGWVAEPRRNGPQLAVRCFGARTLHIVAGNAPGISALTIVRNAILRSDAVIKAPSNDPFTALAIAETMCEMAPEHPITKHLSVAYWRGGDTVLEDQLYQPHNFEKIVAWGGLASVKHVTRYIQPGLELIALDPKRSVSILGREVFESDHLQDEAAVRLATDIGALNQVGCVNARVIFALCGTDAAGIDKLNAFAQRVYEAILALPTTISTKPKSYGRDLRAHVDALRLDEDWYHVIGGEDDEGAIIVSQLPDAVDFAGMLADRTANLVPADTLADAIKSTNAYTQTVGVFPEALKADLHDILPLYGAQRFVSLGYATAASLACPQDGMEVLRRMGKWITNEISTPGTVPPPWQSGPGTPNP
jgi:hypothetical protein